MAKHGYVERQALGPPRADGRNSRNLGHILSPNLALIFSALVKSLFFQASIVWTKTKACATCLVSWLFAFGLTAPVISITTFTADPDTPACLTNVSRGDINKYPI